MSGTTPAAPKRSLFKLLGDLPTLIVDLFRAELDSLKQEIAEKIKHAGIGIGLFAGAAMFLFFAVMALLAAAILGLATVLPAWAAALIIGGAILLIAVVLALAGMASLKKGVPPTPEKTIESVKEDVRTITGTARRTSPGK